jgi:IS5 family transposase
MEKLIEKLFSIFDRTLKDSGYLAMSGQILDATIISAPRQRMTQEEKEKVKEGEILKSGKQNPQS